MQSAGAGGTCSLTLGASPPVRTELLMWAAIGLRHQGRSSFRYILNRAYKKMGAPSRQHRSRLGHQAGVGHLHPRRSGGGHLLRGGDADLSLPTAEVATPALAISFAHFFVGLTCIISQRNILKQIFGYCLMENGSHVTLALLAPTAPEIIEIGIATDAIFRRHHHVRRRACAFGTTPTRSTARDLSELRG